LPRQHNRSFDALADFDREVVPGCDIGFIEECVHMSHLDECLQCFGLLFCITLSVANKQLRRLKMESCATLTTRGMPLQQAAAFRRKGQAELCITRSLFIW
jgi:hypothetical protein